MKILATSDLHGNLPEIPECDLLLIGGDVCPMYDHHVDAQVNWLATNFLAWLRGIPARKIIWIGGNHDFALESHLDRVLSYGHGAYATYLQDAGTDFEGLKIWGLPWVPNLPSWAFHASALGLGEIYDKVPKDTDIVLSHGPARGYGDFTSPKYGSVRVGARTANNMMERVKPKVFICGHIHEGYGTYQHHCQHGHVVDIYNVSFVDENYTPRYIVGEDGHLEMEIAQIMIDAKQESPNPVSELRDQDPDPRLPQESDQGSDSDRDGLVTTVDR